METILVAGHRVANDFQISMIVSCAFASIYFFIAVQIFKLDIARSVMEVVAFQTGLVCYTLFVIPGTIFILSCEVGFFKITFGFKTPNISIGFAAIISVQHFTVISPLGDFGFGIAYIEVCIDSPFIELIPPVQIQFPTARTQITGIGIGGVSTQCIGQYFRRGQHVACFALEPVEANI